MPKRLDTRERIHYRIRKKVNGTAKQPRVAAYRSLKNLYLQAIDDQNGTTIESVSTIEKDLKSKIKGKNKTEVAEELGKVLGSRLKDKGIKTIVFDRGGFRYHGRIKAAADGIRSMDIKF